MTSSNPRFSRLPKAALLLAIAVLFLAAAGGVTWFFNSQIQAQRLKQKLSDESSVVVQTLMADLNPLSDHHQPLNTAYDSLKTRDLGEKENPEAQIDLAHTKIAEAETAIATAEKAMEKAQAQAKAHALPNQDSLAAVVQGGKFIIDKLQSEIADLRGEALSASINIAAELVGDLRQDNDQAVAQQEKIEALGKEGRPSNQFMGEVRNLVESATEKIAKAGKLASQMKMDTQSLASASQLDPELEGRTLKLIEDLRARQTEADGNIAVLRAWLEVRRFAKP